MINPIIINMYREDQERGFDPSSGKYLIGNDFICYHDNDVKHTAIAVKAYPFPYQNIKKLEVAHHCTRLCRVLGITDSQLTLYSQQCVYSVSGF